MGVIRDPGIKSESDLVDLEKKTRFEEKIKAIEEQLSVCNSTLCKLKRIETLDVDNVAECLLHDVDDKTQYKNGMTFVKNSVKTLLS